MKKTLGFIGLLAVSALAFAVTSCTSSESVTQPAAVAEQPSPSNPYYTGDGGKGMSIAILAPKASGLGEDLDYLPNVVQGEFLSNFKGYSAMDVLDRERLDDQYEELFSGYYDDDAEAALDFGHLTPTTYIMGGNITKTASGYVLQIQINKTADKMTAATYSKPCTVAELDNFTGIRRASLDLLQQMKITPTERARTELTEAAAANHVSGQTELARGITAQRRGGEVAALTYYYQAAAYDPSLLEAASRVSVLERTISSGNIGEDRRNDIRWRNDWIARLDEANMFFADYIDKNQPPCEIIYSTSMEAGKTDYSNETVPFTFPVRLFTGRAYFASLEKSVQTVADGLAATGLNGEWRLTWPGNFARSRSVAYDIDFDLVNSGGTVIGTRRVRLDFSWGISGGNKIEVSRPSPGTQQVTITADANGITDALTLRVRAVNGRDPQTANVRITATNERPLPDNDYQFNRDTGELFGISSNGDQIHIPATIWGVPVTSIRYGTIKEGQWRDVSLSISNSVASIEADAFAANQLTSVTIPEGVTYIGDGAFSGGQNYKFDSGVKNPSISDHEFRFNQLTSVTIPGSVTSIGSKAFLNNPLTRVTLSEGVTSIGNSAFAGSRLTSVTIPNSVTSIGERAFSNNNRLTSVTIPANVQLGSSVFDDVYRKAFLSFLPISIDNIPVRNRFETIYNKNGKKAGTYVKSGNRWKYEP